MLKLRLLFLLVSIAVLFSVSAFAVDGVVLINQATVMAAGGFPYHITQPGSYRLSGNLTVPAGVDGIDVNANNVTLDLNGFNIAGPVTCTEQPLTCTGNAGSGIGASGIRNLTVKNGSITGMSTGISVQSFSNGILVEEVHLSQMSFSGMQLSNGIARRNTVDTTMVGIGMEGVVTENNLSGNSVGLACADCVYGSNVFNFNTTNIITDFGAVSQNNNNCNGSVC